MSAKFSVSPLPTRPGLPQGEAPAGTRLWLLRHAEVEARYQGVFGGRIDMDLSPRGHEQAAALARYLHPRGFAALYASPMKRVQQTLAPLLTNGCPQPAILRDLREVDFGDWTGLKWEEVPVKFGVSAFTWLDQLECAGIPNAECSQTLRARLEPCLQQILAKHPGQEVAIACHGGVIRMLLSLLLDWPLSRMGAIEIDYASITQVIWQPAKVQVQLLNFAPWRDLSV
ncbi:MAG TPA: histidine phosphatase family protein [Candidatus Sulfotelmatobacter sp.]|nr:histidine phosphatase family protein [Candidatus Sulfotelmatobacter sp.]HWI57466.1 histidine phosphatase family protein [Bacillota bacterium]